MEEIKLGQVWESRNGAHWLIDQIMGDDWGLTPVRSGELHWQKNGRFWDDKADHSKDLVKRIS